MDPGIGDCVEPMPQLTIEIVEIAERAAEEEVFADIAERPFDFAFRFRSIRPAGARQEAIVPGKVEKRAIVDHEPVHILADDSRLHAIVKDLAWSAADRLESGDMAAQDALQVLMDDEARPDQPGVAEDHGEEPDNAPHARFICERDVELGKIHLRLFARRRLETNFEAARARRPQLTEHVGDGGIAALIATLFEFSTQPASGQ